MWKACKQPSHRLLPNLALTSLSTREAGSSLCLLATWVFFFLISRWYGHGRSRNGCWMSYLIAPRPAFWLSWKLLLTRAGGSCKLDLWWPTRWSSVMLSRNCSWLEKNFWHVNNMLILSSGHWSQTPSAWWPIYEKWVSSLQIDLEASDHAINNSFLGCFLFSKI